MLNASRATIRACTGSGRELEGGNHCSTGKKPSMIIS